MNNRLSATKKDANIRGATALRVTTEATVTPKAAAKSSQKSKDKANAAVQSDRQTSGRPKSVDSVPPSTSTRHRRPDRGPKVCAAYKKRVGRDPKRSASRHRTKLQSGKADALRKASAIGRGIQNKISSKSVIVLIPAPIDDAETLRATEPQVGPIQEDHCASGSHQLLTEENLEVLTQRLESIDPTNRTRSGKRIAVGYSNEDSEDGSSQGSAIGSRERFNRKWGYVPPLDEETIRIIKAILKNPARAETMVGIGPENPEFLKGLRGRNVISDPSTHLDPREVEIQSISVEGFLEETKEQEASHEELWKLDRAKCDPSSSEALYQRTLMISLIARHALIYQLDSSKGQILDFSVEAPWGCPPMPSRLLWLISKGQKSEAKFLTQPMPDLAVCFKREAVIPDRIWNTLPESTKALACFQNSISDYSRIFHFLTVEAKRAKFSLNSPQALYQSLNNASQALHNMFEFFRDAGPEHEQVFYDKVRFFSVVANREGILVRIHRAVRKPDDAGELELIMPDRADYRLEFEFREFQKINADGFSRKRVLEVIKKILKYAKDDLCKLINAAASKLAQNFAKDHGLFFVRVEDFYSYGLPHPKSYKSSKRTSVVPSTIGNGVQQQFRNANLGLKSAPSHQPASEQTTPQQPHQPVISSRLAPTAKERRVAPTAKKRRVDEIRSDELEDMRSPVRKHPRP